MSVPADEPGNPAHAIFERFLRAGECQEVLGCFRELCQQLGLQGSGLQLYHGLKAALNYWSAKALWSKLDKKAGHKDYDQGTACASTKCLVVGAGPCGLRVAIELALLGARVVLVEKRDSFSRNNVLHLWPFTIHDLRALGAKKFYGRFCTGTLDHISIRQLQLILLKVALLLGVEVHINVQFKGLAPPSGKAGGMRGPAGTPPLEVLAERESIYQHLSQTSPDNTNKNISQYSIDPATRYPNINLQAIKANQVRDLYLMGMVEVDHKRKSDNRLSTAVSGDAYEELLSWCQTSTAGYRGVVVTNFTTSWTSGLALCALIHHFRPDLVDFNSVDPQDPIQTHQMMLDTAEQELGIQPVLSSTEMAAMTEPSRLGLITYLSQFYEAFKTSPEAEEVSKKPLSPLGTRGAILFLSKLQKSRNLTHKHAQDSAQKDVEAKRSRRDAEPDAGLDGDTLDGAHEPCPQPVLFPPQPPARGESSDGCYFCGRRVYILERASAEGLFFHRGCFQCWQCGATLRLGDYTFDEEDGHFYCSLHYPNPPSMDLPQDEPPALPDGDAAAAHLPSDAGSLFVSPKEGAPGPLQPPPAAPQPGEEPGAVEDAADASDMEEQELPAQSRADVREEEGPGPEPQGVAEEGEESGGRRKIILTPLEKLKLSTLNLTSEAEPEPPPKPAPAPQPGEEPGAVEDAADASDMEEQELPAQSRADVREEEGPGPEPQGVAEEGEESGGRRKIILTPLEKLKLSTLNLTSEAEPEPPPKPARLWLQAAPKVLPALWQGQDAWEEEEMAVEEALEESDSEEEEEKEEEGTDLGIMAESCLDMGKEEKYPTWKRTLMRQAREAQMKRFCKAQAIQRRLEEIEVTFRELEQQGIKLEKLLRDEDGTPADQKTQWMNQLLYLVQKKNSLMSEESDLMITVQELKLEEQQWQLDQKLRCYMNREESLKTPEDRAAEQEILVQLLEVVNKRNVLIHIQEEKRLSELQA
ncbi:PREDICTED: protein-methionine sulfoxide oxidase MICAL1 [Aptenodytes forsteri]|nr:PREDICTED: protein-methionine sulfoxide oxidase MICAL1 [Aptenodytes forsteri]